VSKVSIIIPTRHETYEVSPGVSILHRTVQDIYEKATGDIEVIVIFDGPPYTPLPEYKNLVCLNMKWAGTKPSINSAAKIASGKYILKTDAHCMFAEGFDEVLQSHMEDNWVVTPRMYILDAENWKWQDGRFYDYFKLPCPFTYKRGVMFQAGGHWKERTGDLLSVYPMDDNMKLHGSCFFTSMEFYWGCLGGLNYFDGAGTWNGEDIEISLKTWLGPWDGKLKVNKETWYAHMHRGGQRPREWHVDTREAYRSAAWTADYWLRNKWDRRTHDLEWLIDKFSPIPGWPENWRELYAKFLEG